MKTRRIIISAVLLIIGLPVVLFLVAGVSYYALMSSYAPNRVNGTIVSSGQKRQYLLYVPKSYDRAKPTPLVIVLHPAALWPSTTMVASGWNKLAEAQGFIVVYPSGTTLSGSGTGVLPFRVWMMEPDTVLNSDVRFISELIDTLEANYNIDPTRIYANGLSNGGGMVFGLSCMLSNRIAAVGAVAAAQIRPFSWCKDSTPVPMIAFHGAADPFVPFNGAPPGWLNPRPFPNVATWAANWARRNRCAEKPVESAVAADVTRREYTNCADSAAVVLYIIKGGGHAWPGGNKPLPAWMVGRTSHSIDATSLMWTFFREHRLPRK
jgi:polyhydroxybutyrate depolymerase